MADRPVVIVSQRLGAPGAEEQRLVEAGAELRGAPLWALDEIRTNAHDAAVLIVGAVELFDAAALESLPNLRALVRRGVGYDNVDAEAATRLGIVVANVPDASVEEVSDHALALLLAIERAIPWLDTAVRNGQWTRESNRIATVRARSRRLSELTVGVLGLGRIGQAFARKARALYGGMLGSDPVVTAEAAEALGIELVTTEELLRRADHVTLHAPLLPSTHHIVNAASLATVRPGAVLVNTSRGDLVDADAVVAAVHEGRLAGAGLDVTNPEPLPAGSPLLTSERILLTAHSAAASTKADRELARRSVDAAVALLAERRPDSIVNPDVLAAPQLRMPGLREAG